jgi:primary-amine oxidase
MKAMKSFIATEDDAKINWSANGNAMYAVVNKDAKNQFGEYPGYRIMPGMSMSMSMQRELCLAEMGACLLTQALL